MPFNMAWFKAQAEKQKAEEAAKLAAERKEQEVQEENQETMEGGYYKFMEAPKNNPHFFMAEELTTPWVNSTDTQRLNMYANHMSQMVHLKTPEIPKVFTNFENQVGEYSIAYKQADIDMKVIAKVIKNAYNYDLIVQRADGTYDIIHYRYARNITEDYGYKLNDCIPEIKVGDTIEKGTNIYKSDNYDEDNNFMTGVNLKTIYLPYKNMTYEDGVVISRSAAEKLTSYKVEKTTISVNNNDILVNLYGKNGEYKSFPKVGEMVNGKVLTASRRKDKRTSLYELQEKNISEINPSSDDVTYTSGGMVVDIDVFNNVPLSELRKRQDVFNQEILEVIESNYRYWSELAEELEKIIPCRELTDTEIRNEKNDFGHVIKHPIDRDKNPNKYTDEVSYYWKLAHEYIDEKILWRYDSKSFDNFKIQFTILKENHLTPGSKITGRYGNKGIISMIIDDEKMPQTVDGERAEICLNTLGVINRLNPAQIKEHLVNFMSSNVLKLMKQKTSYQEKADLFFEYMKYLNKKEYDFLDIEYIGMNRTERQQFIDEIETNGIYVHEPPMFGNTGVDVFKQIYIDHPEWCQLYKFENIERPLLMGELYFIRLKHETSNKSSARSATNLNTKNLPAKSALKKEKKVLMSQTPIRVGEMEVTNLLLAKSPETVEKLLKTYATNENLREELITKLLDPGKLENGHMRNALNMDIDVDLRNNKSISREILEKYMNVLGFSLIDSYDDENQPEGK